MDYRELLVKYARYVRDVEGVNYLDCYRGYRDDQKFTPEEWAELQRVNAEVDRPLSPRGCGESFREHNWPAVCGSYEMGSDEPNLCPKCR